MKIKYYKFLSILYFILLLSTNSYSEILKLIDIKGNDRISNETIKIFSKVSINDVLDSNSINTVTKNLYDTGFFNDLTVSFKNNILTILVNENPIIENIEYQGIKANKIIEILKENSLIKSRSSFNETVLRNENNNLNIILNELGYYNSKIQILSVDKKNNLVDIIIKIELGEKGKIKRIKFVGNKIYKDSKLKRIITSSEYKFWKIISGKKYLNRNLVELDKRLLKNYYKNNGYYNVQINSSFAKLINEDEFELIFNIDANPKIYFGDIFLKIPPDFDENNFKKINKLFSKIKTEPYSINTIDMILEEIDLITEQEQYKFIEATVRENLVENKINLIFEITEGDKFYVEKINIFGNNVTSENVIRNQFEVDEGDPYNELLINKTVNNLKSLNFFKTVKKEVIDNSDEKTKTINISVEEKPTGEIMASAGIGTSGGSVGFGIKENNFLGIGVSLDSNILVDSDAIKGKFSVTNPNFRNSDKSIYISAEALEIDNLKASGYKTNKTGISYGTNFEFLDDLKLGLGNSNFYEKIETNSTASARQQAQEGDYWDSFLNLNFDYDKRNQKFQTSSGFRSYYSTDIPLISDTNTFKNYYSNSYYFDLFDQNISSFSLYLETANSIDDSDVKLSERIIIPSKRLRGFEVGKIGPRDGDDYIGGNYAYSMNFSSTIPQVFQESQNVDFLFFADAADLWGVDYDSSLNTNDIRSSVGLALDWYSPIGPMNFSLAHPISKANTDKTESFRFNLGTTF